MEKQKRKDRHNPITEVNLYIVVATWANDEDEPVGGHPYAIYAASPEEATEKLKIILVQEEIETDPDAHDEEPVTWESIDYDNSDNEGRGFIITDPIEINELIAEYKS